MEPRVSAYTWPNPSISGTTHAQCAEGLHFSAFHYVKKDIPIDYTQQHRLVIVPGAPGSPCTFWRDTVSHHLPCHKEHCSVLLCKTNTKCYVGTMSFLSCLQHFFITQWYHIALATPDIPCTFWRDTVSHHLPCHSMPPCNQGHGTDIQTLSVCVWSRYSQPTEPPECVV